MRNKPIIIWFANYGVTSRHLNNVKSFNRKKDAIAHIAKREPIFKAWRLVKARLVQ